MLGLRRRIAILCAKCVGMIIRKCSSRRGGVLPGYVAQLIDPDILQEMAGMVREKIIVAMGTNGKTTTNSIICHALRTEGKKVLINRTGANMLNGVISAFVLAASFWGRLDVDYACIEVDEFASGEILPRLKPDAVLLTNLFRDQIDRFGEIDIVRDRIRTAIARVPGTKVVSNCDDILSYSLASSCGRPVVTYGISQQIFDGISSPEVRESIFCPSCGKKLAYEFFHYGQLGIYKCPYCGWKRPQPDYTAENIVFEEQGYAFGIGGQQIHSGAKAPYNVYNSLSAYASLQALGAPVGRFGKAVESFSYENNREETFHINGARVCLHLAKNPVGFQQKISIIRKDDAPKDIIVQINDAAQDGRDISWLWDVDFQYLRDANARTIGVAGTRKLDMALRLKYDDIPCSLVKDMAGYVRGITQNGTGNVYLIVNYSGLRHANRMLHKMEDAAEAARQRGRKRTGQEPAAAARQRGRKRTGQEPAAAARQRGRKRTGQEPAAAARQHGRKRTGQEPAAAARKQGKKKVSRAWLAGNGAVQPAIKAERRGML